jgi:hypothetical protein
MIMWLRGSSGAFRGTHTPGASAGFSRTHEVDLIIQVRCGAPFPPRATHRPNTSHASRAFPPIAADPAPVEMAGLAQPPNPVGALTAVPP